MSVCKNLLILSFWENQLLNRLPTGLVLWETTTNWCTMQDIIVSQELAFLEGLQSGHLQEMEKKRALHFTQTKETL